MVARSPLKCKSFRLLSTRVKICQIPHVNFKRKVNSFSIFVSFFIVMTHNSSGSFKLIDFLLWAKGSHQSSNFDTLERSGENMPNSSCHFSNNKSIPLQILYHSSVSCKITPLYFFSSTNIYFAQKEPIKGKIF